MGNVCNPRRPIIVGYLQHHLDFVVLILQPPHLRHERLQVLIRGQAQQLRVHPDDSVHDVAVRPAQALFEPNDGEADLRTRARIHVRKLQCLCGQPTRARIHVHVCRSTIVHVCSQIMFHIQLHCNEDGEHSLFKGSAAASSMDEL